MSDTLDTELKNLEAQLTQLSPSDMPANLLSRMENAMVAWETALPVEEKIVPFQHSEPSKSTFFTWGAAAAVALMAGVGFLLTSGNEQTSNNNQLVDQAETPTTSQPSIAAIAQPQPYKKNLVNASNEGITYAGEENTPYQITHLYYLEEVEITDAQGNKKKIVQPTVEKHLTPVPVN